MSLFTNCSGECCVCGAGSACLAGHGDDDYFPASKEQVIQRLNNGSYASYRNEMIKYLKNKFNYYYVENPGMLYIIRGLPGSGKSTLAHKLGVVHFESDMYAMHNGEYQFSYEKLGEAIQWCNDCVKFSLSKGLEVAAVGTLTRIAHFSGYIKFCEESKIPYKIIRCTSDFGNIHSVPKNVLEKMKNEMEPYEGEYLYDGDIEKLKSKIY